MTTIEPTRFVFQLLGMTQHAVKQEHLLVCHPTIELLCTQNANSSHMTDQTQTHTHACSPSSSCWAACETWRIHQPQQSVSCYVWTHCTKETRTLWRWVDTHWHPEYIAILISYLNIGTVRYRKAVTPETTYNHQQNAKGRICKQEPPVNACILRVLFLKGVLLCETASSPV